MLLFRSLTVGLLGACLYTVLQLTVATPTRPASAATPTELAPPSMTVVDVAAGVPATQVVELLRLGAEERIIAVDDRDVASDLAAGVAIANRARSRQYVDLTIGRGDGDSRRLLVLMH
ncbi:MAG: hypothetical protein WKG01_09070 [Kofleriaceae bacterium]